MAQRIKADDFKSKVLENELAVLVDFYSDSCVPCKQLAPVLGDIEDELEDKLAVFKVNVNFDTDLALQYGVQSSPTIILFKNGEAVKSRSGFAKKDEILKWIDE